MSDEATPHKTDLSAAALRRIERVCVEFEATWKSGPPPRIEDYIGDWQGEIICISCRRTPRGARHQDALPMQPGI